MDKALAKKKADALLEQTGMLESKKKKIKHMSKGMGQIIQFIVTIIHDPKLLIMDEPFSGLDPVNTELMKNMIRGMRNEGRAIILSTHQMNQVEELCDRVLMINHGSEVLCGDLKDIKSRFKKHSVKVSVEGEIGDLPGVIETKLNKNHVELLLAPDETPQTILDRIRDRGMAVNLFEITTPSLNEIFLNIVGGNHE
jgi:ABC-2 type transport system ATP-binding protein